MRLDGELVYDDRWLRSDLRRLRLEKIGFIFQFHNLLPFLTATDNVALVLDLAGRRPREARRRAVELLDYLEVGHRKDAFPAAAVGRRGAARRHRPRAGQPAAHHPGRRADRGARFRSAPRSSWTCCARSRVEQQAAILTVTHDEKIFDRFDRIFDLRDGILIA